MIKKFILSALLVLFGFLLGKFLFVSSNESVVMPLPDNLYRSGGGTENIEALTSRAFTGEIHEVRDGGSIQEAVKKAEPGDLIRVFPGTYRETVYVDKDDIRFQGIIRDGEWPVLNGKKELNDAFLYSGNGITI